MSYGITSYAVDLDRLRRAAGCRDAAMLAAIDAAFDSAYRQNSEWFASEIEAGAPTLRQAVHRIVNNEVGEGHGFQYGYAVEILCRHLGEWYAPSVLSGMRSSFIDTVDKALAELKVDLELSDLVYTGSPIRIPAPDDFPSIGHIAAIDVREHAEALAATDLGVDAIFVDRDAAEAIAELREWLDGAAAGGRDLVGFYY